MRIKILGLFILALAFNACDESFLDIPSENELTINGVYKTQSDFEQAINGVYEPLRDLHDNQVFAMGEIRSDNGYYDYNESNRGQTDHEQIIDFLEDASTGLLNEKYYGYYSVIARANQVISKIDGGDITDQAVKDNIKGQALFLRALAYFDLVQYYGSIPKHDKPVSNMEESALPLSSPEEIYDFIISDAEQAASLLPLKKNQEAGRATKGAAQTLLGCTYILQKNWSDAALEFQKVVDSKEYKLLPNYADVFDPKNKNNDESVFEVQYDDIKDFGSRFLYLLMPAKMTKEEVTAVTGIEEGVRSRNGRAMLPSPDIIAAFEANDSRLDATIGYAVSVGNGADTLLPYVKKYNHPHRDDGRTGDNFPTFRYAEVLLLLAEALNESGSGDPLPHLNAVRIRAGLASTTASGQSAIRDAILAERRVELAFECKRWLDLVRTGNAEAVMKAFGANVKANPVDYFFPEGIEPPDNAFKNIETLFPIPAAEQDLNPYF